MLLHITKIFGDMVIESGVVSLHSRKWRREERDWYYILESEEDKRGIGTSITCYKL